MQHARRALRPEESLQTSRELLAQLVSREKQRFDLIVPGARLSQACDQRSQQLAASLIIELHVGQIDLIDGADCRLADGPQ